MWLAGSVRFSVLIHHESRDTAALSRNCSERSEQTWLRKIPERVLQIAERWSLELHEPYPHATYAWVAPVTRADRDQAVLKLGMPHMEAEHEIAGLRFWQGESMVRLIE
jgi:streptomycin 6-kinase